MSDHDDAVTFTAPQPERIDLEPAVDPQPEAKPAKRKKAPSADKYKPFTW